MLTWTILIGSALGMLVFTRLQEEACRIKVDALLRDDANTLNDTIGAGVAFGVFEIARLLCLVGAAGAALALVLGVGR